MKKILTPSLALVLAGSLLLQSCVATIVSGPKQTVRVVSQPPGATVLVNEVPQTKRGLTPNKVRLRRNKSSEVRVRLAGYKDHIEILTPAKPNPLAFLSLFAFVIPYYVDLATGAAICLNKKEIRPVLIKIPPKMEGSVPVVCNSISVRVKGGDKVGNLFIKDEPKEILYFGKSIDAKSETLQDEVNSNLSDLGYTVPKGSGKQVFSSSTGAKYFLTGEVSSITYNVRASNKYRDFARFETTCKMDVTWKLVNRKKETVLERKVSGASTKFEEGGSAVFTDAFENALYAALNEAELINMLKSTGKKELDTEPVAAKDAKEGDKTADTKTDDQPIALVRPVPAASKESDLTHATKGVVTIVSDEGHGSGVIVSSEGYVVTNYHVVDGAADVLVRLASGDSIDAHVIRANEEMDLALLKLAKAPNLQPLQLVDPAEPLELGADVFAIGTPADQELGQTVTKGIISGERKMEGLNFIQTDVSINPGNSGGALVNRSGVLLGIVNAKMVGRGIEGLGFAIPVKRMLEVLKLTPAKP